jgi:glycosyltransferase involved in cell wall biosynthesis
MARVLLVGPNYGTSGSYYGGGIGGYTRNMNLYLKEFNFTNIHVEAYYCTSRKKKELKLFSFPIRFFLDIFRFLQIVRKGHIDIVHILGQYRTAIPREFAWILVCKLYGIKTAYDIKAGQFKSASDNSNIHALFAKYILKNSDLILAEGLPYLPYVKSIVDKSAIYFPNVIASSEIPIQRKFKKHPVVDILFVGYCNESKGVYDLINAVYDKEITHSIKVELIGAQSPRFSVWLKTLPGKKNIQIISHGRKPHDFVLEKMAECTYYVYPSRHIGEGHNNSINEAMMNSMVIIASKAGFLGNVLENCGYSLIDGAQNYRDQIVIAIQESILDWAGAVECAKRCRNKIEMIYNSEVQGRILESQYNKILR